MNSHLQGRLFLGLLVSAWLLSLGQAHMALAAAEGTVSLPQAGSDPEPEAEPSAHPSAHPSTHPSTHPSAPPTLSSGAPRWYPGEMKPAKWDWVLLNTGEWIKGTIDGIRNDRMEFDSDKFDDLQIKMKDVVRTYSVTRNTFVFTEQRVVIGVGKITRDSVVIEKESGPEVYPRQELISLAVGDRTEWKLWSGKTSLGISSSSGNTSQLNANIQASLRRQGAFLRLDTLYYGNFGQSNGETNVDNQRMSFQADLFVKDRFFLIPAVIEYYTDAFANIDFRVRPGAGMGYQIAQKTNVDWEVTVLGQYQYLSFISTAVGEPTTSGSFAVSAATKATWDITGDITLDINYALTLPTSGDSKLDQQATVSLEIDITKYLTVNSTLNWTRIGSPQQQANGAIPEKDDLAMSVGLGFNF
jgi:hypothetical protein